MPTEPTVALVFAPDPWVEQLHRFLADHGGARVRQIVVDPSLALDDEYDVLIAGDRWPSLTRGLVDRLHDAGRSLLGVYDPNEPAGKDHLAAVGVDAVLPADAAAAEFVATLEHLVAERHGLAADASAVGTSSLAELGRTAPSRTEADVVLVGGGRGAGRTEIALTLAAHLAERSSAVLIDARIDEPAISVRLGLAMEPNVRTAVEEVVYGHGDIRKCSVGLGRRGLGVIGGFPSLASAQQVASRDVHEVVCAARVHTRWLVVEADDEVADRVLQLSPTIVCVVAPHPVGVARGLAWLARVQPAVRDRAVHVVVNRAPRDRFRRAEVSNELFRAFEPTTLTFVPHDARVERAAWEGSLVGPGPFDAAVSGLAQELDPGSMRERRARRRRRVVR